MKKLLLILLCLPMMFSCDSNKKKENTVSTEKSQEEKRIDDFNEYGILSLDLEGGNDSLFEVSISGNFKEEIDLDYFQIGQLLIKLNFSSQYNCEHKRTYIPNDVFCFMDDSIPNLLNVYFTYVGSNAYGVPGDIATTYKIDMSLFKKYYEDGGILDDFEYIVDEITY